jgi:hypothetical protein
VRRHLPRFLTLLVILLTFGLALTSAVQKSPTMDEQNHIARGVAYLGTGDPRLSVEHPPLVNLLSGLPVHLLLHPSLPLDTVWWEAGEWYHFADLFLWEANPDPERVVFLARLPVLGLGLLLIALVHRWAGQRFGPWGGLLAAAFCGLDPNILAHARLATTDVGGTFFIFLAGYALWRALRRPSVPRLLGAGLALGLAFAAKLSALAFGPLLALTALLDGLPGGPGRGRRVVGRAGLMLGVLFLGLVVVWATYRFQVGPLGENGPLVPAPPYLRGIGAVLDFAAGGRPGYLLGEVSTEGWWTYFPVAFGVKTPLATLVGLVVATGLALRRPTHDDLLLLVPPVAFFLASTLTRLNLGYRHLLPILPFLFIHLARLPQSPNHQSPSHQSPSHPATQSPSPMRRLLPPLLALWLALATLHIYPHFLAFFNPLGGGPEEGWRVLADSNIDWGQDLKGLRAWMDREGVERVRLAWFGSARPEAYGIPHDLLPGVPHGFFLSSNPPFNPDDPEPGVYAISVSNLVGAALPDPDLYAWFRDREPEAKIGYSVFIYRVEP